MSQNIFAYFSVSERSAYFFNLFHKKNTYFGYGQEFCPPPSFSYIWFEVLISSKHIGKGRRQKS